MKRISITLENEHLEILDKYKLTSRSELIRRAIELYEAYQTVHEEISNEFFPTNGLDLLSNQKQRETARRIAKELEFDDFSFIGVGTTFKFLGTLRWEGKGSSSKYFYERLHDQWKEDRKPHMKKLKRKIQAILKEVENDE